MVMRLVPAPSILAPILMRKLASVRPQAQQQHPFDDGGALGEGAAAIMTLSVTEDGRITSRSGERVATRWSSSAKRFG